MGIKKVENQNVYVGVCKRACTRFHFIFVRYPSPQLVKMGLRSTSQNHHWPLIPPSYFKELQFNSSKLTPRFDMPPEAHGRNKMNHAELLILPAHFRKWRWTELPKHTVK